MNKGRDFIFYLLVIYICKSHILVILTHNGTHHRSGRQPASAWMPLFGLDSGLFFSKRFKVS